MFEELSPDPSPAMQRFWSDYRARIQHMQDHASVCVLPARSPAREAGNFGRLAVYIVVRFKQILCRDGHDRAARREAAWYNF